MRTIYKYEFQIDNNFTLILPDDHEILKVGTQSGVPCMWIMIDDLDKIHKTSFSIYGNGHKIEDPIKKYIGTIFRGPLVWHIFKDI